MPASTVSPPRSPSPPPPQTPAAKPVPQPRRQLLPDQENRPPQKGGNYDLVDLIIFIGVAALFDIFAIIDLGILGLAFFWLMFYLKGVTDSYVNIIGAILALGSISFLPPSTAFVIIVYIHTKAKEGSAAAQVAETAIKVGAAAATGGAGGAASGGAAVAEGGAAAEAGTAAQAAKTGAGAEDRLGQQLRQQMQKGSGQGGKKDDDEDQQYTGASGSPLVEGQPQATPEDIEDDSVQGQLQRDRDKQDLDRDLAIAGDPERIRHKRKLDGSLDSEEGVSGPAADNTGAPGKPLVSGSPYAGSMTSPDRYTNMSYGQIQKEMKDSSSGYSSAWKEESKLEKQMKSFRDKGQHGKADTLQGRYQNAQNAKKYHSRIMNDHYDELRKRDPNRDPNA